jgi:hypothetical protein
LGEGSHINLLTSINAGVLILGPGRPGQNQTSFRNGEAEVATREKANKQTRVKPWRRESRGAGGRGKAGRKGIVSLLGKAGDDATSCGTVPMAEVQYVVSLGFSFNKRKRKRKRPCTCHAAVVAQLGEGRNLSSPSLLHLRRDDAVPCPLTTGPAPTWVLVKSLLSLCRNCIGWRRGCAGGHSHAITQTSVI